MIEAREVIMEKETKRRLFRIVEGASRMFGGIYSRIFDSISKSPDSESTDACLSGYADCKDTMDFVLAYEVPGDT